LTATNVSDFDFHLPDHLIAQDARPRGQSRLMIVDRAAGNWRADVIGSLPLLFAPGDLMVVNDTRVFPARLVGRRDPSGGGVECFLLSRLPNGDWDALVSPGKHLGVGARAIFDDPDRAPGIVLNMEVISRGDRGRRVVRFEPENRDREVFRNTSRSLFPSETTPDVVFAAIEALGHVPLPPYIRRDDTPEDRERYQTVYARETGSVAAPTAGLHFDQALLDSLERAGVKRAGVTLHVGYGTFKPMHADRVEDHVVDPEPYEIPPGTADAIRKTRAAGRRVIAVGTTSTRALEHAAASHGGHVEAGAAMADNFLYPGHRFAAVDALVTNFHLPKSSLLMLVAAFGGTDLILAAYRDAVASGFHFYSYGDAMVVV
jgi:S-adenosylmethionine:tRNA ribosyltransferase-isomerase